MIKCFCVLTILLLRTNFCNSSKIDFNKANNPFNSIWFDYFQTFGIGEIFENFVKDVFKEPTQCNSELKIFYNSIKIGETWALHMLDATAKPQTGILSGNVLHVGNFDECIKVNVKFNQTINIKGRYCTALISESNEKPFLDDLIEDSSELMKMRLSYGFCLPQSCKADDLQKIAHNLETTLNAPLHFYFFDEFCTSSDDETRFEWMDILCLSFFSFLAILIVFGTIYDILVSKGKNDTLKLKIYTLFSFYTNSKSLFSTKTSKNSIKCLNGMKVLSLAWIVLSHRYMYTLYTPLINYDYISEMFHTYPFAVILMGTLAVDTFLLITGLLIVYLFLVQHSKNDDVSWVMFYVHRILRLTPSLGAMVLVYSTIFDNIGSGPFWFLIKEIFQDFCRKNWWSTLLFVQNYVHPNQICVGQSWYLAIDTQLYFLSPILLVVLIKWPALAIGGSLALVFVSDGYTFMSSYSQKLQAGFFGTEKQMFRSVYVPTHARCSPWFLGAILGYIIFKIRDKSMKFNKIWALLCWLVALLSICAMVHVHKLLGTVNNEEQILENALYNSLIRTLWGLVLSLVILLCITDNGGLINKILSWPIFVVMSKLCYSMYLTQLLVIIATTAQTRTPEYLSHMNKIKQFFGDFVTIFLISVVWTLTFESPVIQIEKILFKRKKPISRENVTSTISNEGKTVGHLHPKTF